jgi:hypothetical protein
LDDGLFEPAKHDLGLSQLARLFRCSCSGCHWSAKQCLACPRRGRALPSARRHRQALG